MQLHLKSVSSLEEIGARDWNDLAGGDPFLRHEFLIALEHSRCVGNRTAWQPVHLVVTDVDGRLVGALPLYQKYDSRGEFVFDWSWADAYERSGRSYYPKLVSSVPFTPANGRRLLVKPGLDPEPVARRLISGVRELAREVDASSVHVLFPEEAECAWLAEEGFLTRKGCQFHWHNAGYENFEQFLGEFSSAKRKKARRERRRIEEAGIELVRLRGDEPSRAEWKAILEFYTHTFVRRGRPPYLNGAFFREVAETMPENLLIVLARYRGQPIATAICFRGADTLYGRYWGSLADFHSLHFEVCYYQGIEYCIREGLKTFEPGTQGEHKISRGFVPAATWSSHWLADETFRRAVAEFLTRETQHVDLYMDELADHIPYRQDVPAE